MPISLSIRDPRVGLAILASSTAALLVRGEVLLALLVVVTGSLLLGATLLLSD